MFSQRETVAALRSMTPSPVEELPLVQGMKLICHFYESQLSSDAVPENEDGDMLLFEWGAFDWGDGQHFSLGLTRQLIYPDGPDELAIW